MQQRALPRQVGFAISGKMASFINRKQKPSENIGTFQI
jgi:hypothetical protein